MRVLILGCGYVGLPLGAKLALEGHEVYGVRRSDSAAAELRSRGIIPFCADVSQPESLKELPRGYDWVVHCVSASGGGAAEYRRVYLDGTRNVLQWLAAAPPQKFVYTSSTSVYAQTDGSVVDESSAAEPIAETAQILLETEGLILAATRSGEIPGIILRMAGIYGPGRGYWLKQYLTGHAQLEGSGERWLNMVHRDDVVGALAATLQAGRPGEIYNVVDDEPTTQRGLFQWLASRTGGSMTAGDLTASPRKRGITSKRVSNQKLKHDLGYRFLYPSFREGFEPQLASR